jgi:hypothetical protein
MRRLRQKSEGAEVQLLKIENGSWGKQVLHSILERWTSLCLVLQPL